MNGQVFSLVWTLVVKLIFLRPHWAEWSKESRLWCQTKDWGFKLKLVKWLRYSRNHYRKVAKMSRKSRSSSKNDGLISNFRVKGQLKVKLLLFIEVIVMVLFCWIITYELLIQYPCPIIWRIREIRRSVRSFIYPFWWNLNRMGQSSSCRAGRAFGCQCGSHGTTTSTKIQRNRILSRNTNSYFSRQ